MGDLGSDAGQSAVSLGAKALEAILRLLEKMMDAIANRHRRELEKLNLQKAKDSLEQQKALERIQYKKGFVDYQDLRRSGLELQSLNIFMTKDEMKAFAEICKREGVLFSGMTDSTKLNEEGEKTFELICKKEDLEKVNQIFNRINDEKKIAGIDNRIEEIKTKAAAEGRDLTQDEKTAIDQLKEERAAMQRSYCEKMNDETAQNVIDKAVSGEVGKKLTLDDALNRLTGRSIDRDVVTIVADANDPSKYIKCHGYQDLYHDKPYIKTEYEVFKNAQSVLKTHDGRFDGRPEGYWGDQKAAIQKAGEFSGTFFKFYSVVEFQKWAEATKSQNTQELSSMAKEGDKDYSDITKELEVQLDKDGAKMQDGKVVDKQTGEPLAITEDMTKEQQAIVAEATVIGKQINNYQEIQQLSDEISLAQAEVLTADEGTAERNTAEGKLSNLQGRYDAALATEQQLITERREINAVQAEQEVRNAPEQTKAKEIEYLPEDKAKIEALEAKIAEQEKYNYDFGYAIDYSDDPQMRAKERKELEVMEEKVTAMKDELAQLKAQAADNAHNAEHPDERRGERVDEKDNRQMTMEEVKGQIAEQRGKDGTKTNDVKDHQVQDQGAKAAMKTAKTHDDR